MTSSAAYESHESTSGFQPTPLTPAKESKFQREKSRQQSLAAQPFKGTSAVKPGEILEEELEEEDSAYFPSKWKDN